MKENYHHGNLRAELLQAAEILLAESGLEGFSLREVARRAGVSPGAPKHHFADLRALFTAIAIDAFVELADGLEQASADTGIDRVIRIHRQGVAYVEFAIGHRARFDLMWRKALLDGSNKAYQHAADRAFSAIDKLVRGENAPRLPKSDPALAPTIACWSLVHGFAQLAIAGAFGKSANAVRSAVMTLLPEVLDKIDL